MGFEGAIASDAQTGEIVAAIETAIEAGTLSSERLADASRRIGRLVDATVDAPECPAVLSRGSIPGLDTTALQAGFQVADAVAARLPLSPSEVAWVRLEPAANIAVGPSPWGPFASGVTADAVVTRGWARLVGASPGTDRDRGR